MSIHRRTLSTLARVIERIGATGSTRYGRRGGRSWSAAPSATPSASFRRLHETLLDRVEFSARRNACILATLDEAGNLWIQLDVVLPGAGAGGRCIARRTVVASA
jgi:hypothetical protein